MTDWRALRVLGISGSLQQGSGNTRLLQTAASVAPGGVEVRLCDNLRALPHFDPDLEQDGPPEAVTSWRRALAECDALLVACPEYGFSLPGALKNGIDWVIGSGELERKPVAITAAVSHATRGRRGLAALRQTLEAVSARIVGGEPIAHGASFERDIAALLEALVVEAREPDRPPEPVFE